MAMLDAVHGSASTAAARGDVPITVIIVSCATVASLPSFSPPHSSWGGGGAGDLRLGAHAVLYDFCDKVMPPPPPWVRSKMAVHTSGKRQGSALGLPARVP